MAGRASLSVSAVQSDQETLGPLSGFIIWQQSEKCLRPHALSALVPSMCVFSIPYIHRTKNLKSRNRKLDSKRSKGFILTQQRRKTRGDWEEKSPHSLINPFLHPPASTGSTQSALVSLSSTFPAGLTESTDYCQCWFCDGMVVNAM